MIRIDVRADVAALTKRLGDLERRQIPFATSQALTAIARKVQAAEMAALSTTLDNPTPFTLKSVAVIPARKATQEAVVFVKDIAAAYLAPFEFGGPHFLGSKRALLNPKAQPVNQYGNLPRTTLARLKSRPNVFVGTIKTKSGAELGGVFERLGMTRTGRVRKARKGQPAPHGLKLLIRFSDPLPVKPTLHYRDRARKIVEQSFAAELSKALAAAMKTAR